VSFVQSRQSLQSHLNLITCSLNNAYCTYPWNYGTMELINFLAELRAGAVATVAVRIRAWGDVVLQPTCRPAAGSRKLNPGERIGTPLEVPLIRGFWYTTSLPIGLRKKLIWPLCAVRELKRACPAVPRSPRYLTRTVSYLFMSS
jgi:hypothetical protein